jgi:hypothetical protein
MTPRPPFLLAGWFGPPAAQLDDHRMAEMVECGLNVVPPPFDAIDAEAGRRFLDLCSAHGVHGLLVDPRVRITATGDLSTRLDAADADFGSHPSLYGYVLDDEPPLGRFAGLAALSDAVRARWDDVLPLVCLLPNFAVEAQLGTTSYREHVARYLDIVRPPLFLFDHYATLTEGERPEFYENLEIVRDECQARGVPWAMALNTVEHMHYREQSEGDLRWQAFSAIAYGAVGLIYYTYWTPPAGFEPPWEYGDAIIDREGNRTPRYEPVRRLNHDVSAMAGRLVAATSRAVHHLGDTPPGVSKPGEPLPLGVGSDGPLLVGVFDHADGAFALVVNRDPSRAHDVKTDDGGLQTLAAGDAMILPLSE